MSAESDLAAKCKALEEALTTLQREHEVLQSECDTETEQRMELALEVQQLKSANDALTAQVQQLERALKIEQLTNEEYATERVEMLEELDQLRDREIGNELQPVVTVKKTLSIESSAPNAPANLSISAQLLDEIEFPDVVETPTKNKKKKKSSSSSYTDDTLPATLSLTLSPDVPARGASSAEEIPVSTSLYSSAPPEDGPIVSSSNSNGSPNKNTDPALRTAAAQEIIESERKYVAFLNKILTAFRDPMLSEQGAASTVVTSEQVKKIFGNTDVIYGLSKSLLTRLDQRMQSYDNQTTTISDIFLSIQPFLKAYNEFANKFNRALEALDWCRTDARFRDWLGATERMHGILLRDLLIMPVQRLPRYVMLLDQLSMRTPLTHPDSAGLVSAVRLMKETTEYVNSRRAEYESLAMVQQLGARLVGYDVFAAATGVLHIKDGRLQQTGPERHADVHVILLTNVFLVARRTSTLRAAISRGSGHHAAGLPLRVKDVVPLYRNQLAQAVVGDANSFTVDVSESSLSRPLKFLCDSQSERDAWVASVVGAVQRLTPKE